MKDDVLSLFEGLSKIQAERLRAGILPTLQEVRRIITGEAKRMPVAELTRGFVTQTLDGMDENIEALPRVEAEALALAVDHERGQI
jgi:hypothetical protein